MKPIKITQQNAEKIEAALAEVNGKATSFTLTRFADVSAFADDAEAQLSILPKKEQVGAKARCIPAGPTANSYKYAAKSTQIQIERRATGWFLVGVAETQVYPKQNGHCLVTISKAQAEEIQRRAIADFLVTQ